MKTTRRQLTLSALAAAMFPKSLESRPWRREFTDTDLIALWNYCHIARERWFGRQPPYEERGASQPVVYVSPRFAEYIKSKVAAPVPQPRWGRACFVSFVELVVRDDVDWGDGMQFTSYLTKAGEWTPIEV